MNIERSFGERMGIRAAVMLAALAVTSCRFEPPRLEVGSDGSSGFGDAGSADSGMHEDGGAPRDALTSDAQPPPPGCGDGVTLGAEGCDDANTTALDGCSDQCTLEPGYQCSGQPSTCTNPAPIVMNDEARTNEDVAVTIDVLANDLDAFADVLEITQVTSPVHGTVATLRNGSLAYTPDANYFGMDAFRYTVRDAAGSTGTATVSLTIEAVDDPPVALDVTGRTPFETTVPLELSASDLEGDLLTYVIVRDPTNGQLISATDGDAAVSYRPNAGFDGVDTFTYKAVGATLSSNTATVSVIVLSTDWRDIGSTRRRQITIDNTSGAQSIVNLHAYVALDSTIVDYASMRADGRDLRFLARTGAPFDYEIERWDPSGTSSVWVRVPNIASSTTTTFFMYYANPLATPGDDVANTWNQSYLGVWHLDTLAESISGAPAIDSGTSDVQGIAGRARSFDGASVIDLGVGYLDSSIGSLSVWARAPQGLNLTNHALVVYGTDSNSGARDGFGTEDEMHVGLTDQELYQLYIEGNGGPRVPLRVTSPAIPGGYTDGAWHYIALSWDEMSVATMYIDGVEVDSAMHDANTFTCSVATRIGGPIDAIRRFVGDVDEVRISNVPRSPAAVEASYRVLVDPTFVTIGAEDDGSR